MRGDYNRTTMDDYEFKVRPAVEVDYQSAVALFSQFHSSTSLGEEIASEDQWHQLLRYPGTTVFVADFDGLVVGSLTLHVLPNMTRNGRPYALIENVITDEDHRGKGVGRLIMERAIQTASSVNAYKVMLLTGKHRSDGVAATFYKKLGFSDDKKYGMYLAIGEPVEPHQ